MGEDEYQQLIRTWAMQFSMQKFRDCCDVSIMPGNDLWDCLQFDFDIDMGDDCESLRVSIDDCEIRMRNGAPWPADGLVNPQGQAGFSVDARGAILLGAMFLGYGLAQTEREKGMKK